MSEALFIITDLWRSFAFFMAFIHNFGLACIWTMKVTGQHLMNKFAVLCLLLVQYSRHLLVDFLVASRTICCLAYSEIFMSSCFGVWAEIFLKEGFAAPGRILEYHYHLVLLQVRMPFLLIQARNCFSIKRFFPGSSVLELLKMHKAPNSHFIKVMD